LEKKKGFVIFFLVVCLFLVGVLLCLLAFLLELRIFLEQKSSWAAIHGFFSPFEI
jgi:hypothetical protein